MRAQRTGAGVSARGALLEALCDTAPLIAGMTPFAVAFGAIAVSKGLPATAVVGMSAMVYAGLAQFTVVNLYASGVGNVFVLIACVVLINLRFSLMGISLLPHTGTQPRWVRAGLAFGLSDEPYAAVIQRFTSRGYSLAYQCSAYGLVYAAWVLGTAGGVAFGELIADPMAWGLDFAMVATFLVLLLPRLKDRATVVAALVSGGFATLLQRTVLGEGSIVLASVVGFAAVTLLRWRATRSGQPRDGGAVT